MVIGIFKAPFTNMSELAIPKKGLFTRVDLERFNLSLFVPSYHWRGC
jgi:hypothetical protein